MNATAPYRPLACVWEITLACNARCIHCGSSAGVKRAAELNTDEALGLVNDLSKLGCRSVTLSGGEPLLRKDWCRIAAAIRDAGMRLEMITNGLEVEAQADLIAHAGFFAVTFSVDGPEAVHDGLRQVKGGFLALLRGAQALAHRGILIGAVTQVNRHNVETLDSLFTILDENGFKGWQFQLTMPHGRAKHRDPDLCLSPADLPKVEQTFLGIRKRTDMFIQAADNFGYMGKGEAVLRGGQRGTERFYQGCSAGTRVVGVTSEGTIRGCLSLPSVFDEGNIRERSLKDIWNKEGAFKYNRHQTRDALEGACGNCPLNRICRAGCRSLAYATTGATTHNPYCLRRIEEGWKSL